MMIVWAWCCQTVQRLLNQGSTIKWLTPNYVSEVIATDDWKQSTGSSDSLLPRVHYDSYAQFCCQQQNMWQIFCVAKTFQSYLAEAAVERKQWVEKDGSKLVCQRKEKLNHLC